MSKEFPILIRDANSKDVPFIFASWLDEYRKSRRVDDVPNDPYHYGQHKVIEDLLLRGKTYIACFTEDTDLILGYLVGEHFHNMNVVHMLLTKKKTMTSTGYQKLGVATSLFDTFVEGREELPLFYTHATKLCNQKSRKELAERGRLKSNALSVPDDRGWFRDKLREKNATYDPYLGVLTHVQLGVASAREKWRCPKCKKESNRRVDD